MNKELIYDVGMHLAQDTGYYLSKGYRVVAVDAFPEMLERASAKYNKELADSRLQLVNFAMTDKDNDRAVFHVSDKTEWNSLSKEISSRQNQQVTSIEVPTAKLSTLFKQYGTPFYCKIDVEGYDAVCIDSLVECDELPQYISCETECFYEGQQVTEKDVLATLDSLKKVGYKKFKLVDQETLILLKPGKSFYKKTKPSLITRVFNKLKRAIFGKSKPNKLRLDEKWGYEFPFGATGPFGKQLEGEWMDYDTAKKCILFHREEFFARETSLPKYTIWCDWHATI